MQDSRAKQRRLSGAGAVIRLGIGAALCLLTAAASTDVSDDLPVLGDASSSMISPELERQIGRDFLKQVHAGLPTISDPVLKHFVTRQLTDLLQYSQVRENLLGVVLIDSDQINAFAAPGGVVGVNLGLLLHAQDVHEYSSVMAHELAHLSQRHFARGVEEARSKTLPTIASLLAAIMIGAVGGGEAGMAAISASQAASQSSQLRYSRGREQEADRIGLNTIVRAGMDPDGMARMFERMQRNYRFSRTPPEFLLTHPLSETRISDAKSQAREYPQRDYADSPDYAMMRVRAQIYYAPNAAGAVAQFEKAVRDDPESVPARYGLALAQSRAGLHAEAIAGGDALFTADPQKILYIASYAELLIEAEKLDQATRLLSHHLALNPDNATLAAMYSEALIRDQRYREAEAVLERQSVVNKDDVDVWYNLAEVSGKAGNIIGVHRARAEYFALHGAYQRAIQHLEYARRLVREDNQQLHAMLDQRINDMRMALRMRRS
ncbi:MAG TPA: M48 family metalloprotease [Pseudomonadales bacterium]